MRKTIENNIKVWRSESTDFLILVRLILGLRFLVWLQPNQILSQFKMSFVFRSSFDFRLSSQFRIFSLIRQNLI